jgi:hypothetical protein
MWEEKMTGEYKNKKIKIGEEISFIWMHPTKGWAHLDICQVWKRGRIEKIFIVPRQQDNAFIFSFAPPKDYKATELNISSYGCEEEAQVTSNSYCDVHKAINTSMNVPKGSNYFKLSLHFGNSICMEFHKK